MSLSAGYSGTPLAKKLGIKENLLPLLLFRPPERYTEFLLDTVGIGHFTESIEADTYNFIHLFFTHQLEFNQQIDPYLKVLAKDGMMWISWPKGKSDIPTDLKRDLIRNTILEKGLVDVKVAAIDDQWSGLKFVYRKKDR